MENLCRSIIRKSAAPVSPPRSESASSPDRTAASTAPAAPDRDREGGDERMHHRGGEGGDTILKKKGCLNDEELPMDQHTLHAQTSHSSSQSGDTHKEEAAFVSQSGDTHTEEAPFDGEKTVDKKPKPYCSGDCGKNAEDEDGHSKKKPPSSMLQDEQHSDKIVVHAIEDREKKQGTVSRRVQALLDMDDETLAHQILCLSDSIKFVSPELDPYPPEYEENQIIDLYEQLALYRIRAYELMMDKKLPDLDDANLKMQYPRPKLFANHFFKYYEEFLGWYFELDLCKNARFDNYQRLVLPYCGYLDWDEYQTFLNTYEEDLAYVKYFEEVANRTKWIEDCLENTTVKWQRIENVAHLQAMKTLAEFPNLSPLLVSSGFQEYMDSIKYDYTNRGLHCFYFEIWKRVAKEKMSFREALLEVQRENMFPSRDFAIKHELETASRLFRIDHYYDTHVAGIDKMASDDKALQLIREAVVEMEKD